MGQPIPPIIEALLTSFTNGDHYERGRAAEALVRLGYVTQPILAELIYYRSDPVIDHDRSPAEAWKQLGQTTPSVALIVSALLTKLSHGAWEYRSSAAEELGQLGHATSSVIEALLNCFSDPEWYVRWCAAKSLGQDHLFKPSRKMAGNSLSSD